MSGWSRVELAHANSLQKSESEQLQSVFKQKFLWYNWTEITSVSSSILAPSACRSASSVSKGVLPDMWSVIKRNDKKKKRQV